MIAFAVQIAPLSGIVAAAYLAYWTRDGWVWAPFVLYALITYIVGMYYVEPTASTKSARLQEAADRATGFPAENPAGERSSSVA